VHVETTAAYAARKPAPVWATQSGPMLVIGGRSIRRSQPMARRARSAMASAREAEAFLDHLERERGNSARTRNARLAAIHSFFQYAALRSPAEGASIQRVLAIPTKRIERAVVDFLAPSEVDALLAAPDTSTWIGRRDHAILLVAVQTGLRASELTGLRRHEVIFGQARTFAASARAARSVARR
jgi:site-specific recombinase XerD